MTPMAVPCRDCVWKFTTLVVAEELRRNCGGIAEEFDNEQQRLN